MQRNFFIQIYEDLYGDAMLLPIQILSIITWQKHVTEFCYKSLNLSLKELKNIETALFLIQIPWNKSLFKALSAIMQSQLSYKSLDIQNQEHILSKNVYEN